jgi:Calcium-dependent channel, 7TM region, putative phosphate/Cytosolic domain of 10TM putative phosphate transporter/Late exocytosis, associated with Golgi transport
MDDSLYALLFTILIEIIVFSVEITIFSVYRTYRNRPVSLEVEGKDIKVPVFSESDTPLIDLLRGVWSVPFSDIGFYCGIEGKLYLAFLKTMGQMMAVLCSLGLCVLIPVYLLGNSEVNKDMNYISMAHIIEESYLMIVVLVFFFIFTFIILGFIGLYTREVVKAYSMPSELICSINKYTIELRGLPIDMEPGQVAIELKEMFCEQFPEDIQSIYVVPNISEAYRLHLKLEEANKEHLHYLEYLRQKGERAKIRRKYLSFSIDAISYYQEKRLKLAKKFNIQFESHREECSGYAYILCKTPFAAINVKNNFERTTDFLNCKKWILSIAPAPSEINWQNLRKHNKKMLLLRLIIIVFFILFFFIFVTPASFLQIMIELTQFTGLQTITRGLINQVLPSLIIFMYQSLIVRQTVLFLVRKQELENKSEEIISGLTKFLYIMVTYEFLVPLLGLQVYSIITDTFVGGFERSQSGFANQAAFSGEFFMIFVINLTFLKNGSDILQIPKLFRVKFRQSRAVNERERLQAYEAYEFRWPYEYGVSLCALFVILAFSIAYPLILVIGIFFFTTRYFIAKYNMLCFYCTVKTTTGHKIPKVIITAMLSALLLFQCFTCALIFLSNSTTYFKIATVLLIVSIIMYVVLFFLRDKLEVQLMKGLDIESLEEDEMIFGEDINKYYHPLESNATASRVLIERPKLA